MSAAMSEDDPGSLGAATRLRSRFAPELAAAALIQAELRRLARSKFGSAAAELWFTRDGLEQASRPEVADRHAQRFVQAGATRVVDLGCGIGSDAMAFCRAGLDVVAVEIDPATASVAAANLAGRAEVVCADAAEVAGQLLGGGIAVFCDPARRNERGRLWRVEDFSPDWSLVTGLLDGSRVAGVKLGPALPHNLIPGTVEAEWVGHRGDTVEVALWAGPGATPGRRSAWLWPDIGLVAEPGVTLPVRPLGSYLYEPAGAVIRSGGIGVLGRSLQAGLLDPHLAYLTGDISTGSPLAATFRVLESFPYEEKHLRSWVREHGVGVLEIKKRGLELDPAALRKRLRLAGAASATVVISRTPSGAVAAVVERV
jgi:SAM-dependent methyltransferase